MFAIIKTGGKQVKVEPGQEIFIEKVKGEVNDKVEFDQVMMIDGTVGSPLIKDGKVSGTIVKQGKGNKLRVVRYHPKKNVRRVMGHRQPYTKVKIDEIFVGASKLSAAKPAAPKAAAKPADAKAAPKADAKPAAKPAAKKATASKESK